jgi:hypothetical protein
MFMFFLTISIGSPLKVNVLRKLQFTLSKQSLSNIDLTFIRPTLEYACEVWGGCFEREVAKLEKVQLEYVKDILSLLRGVA